MSATPLSDTRLELGEGARWVDGRLICVDILAGVLYEHAGTLRAIARLDIPLGAVAPVRDRPGTWVAAAGDGIGLLKPDGTLVWLDRPEQRNDGSTRMNDGVCDPRGRFWAGSMAYNASTPEGSLYRVDPDGSVTCVLDGLVISNGPAFTHDGGTMYLADTARRMITRYRVDSHGDLSGGALFAQLEDGLAPDGMTTDSDGNLWTAIWGGAHVRRYSPAGDVTANIELPARQPTSICLVKDRALVTSAYIGLDSPTDFDGHVYAISLASQGLRADAPSAWPFILNY